MARTLRRPVNPQVPLAALFPDQLLVELPFPDEVAVVDNLIYGYLDEQRIPSHTVYVLDVSGSMEGDRLDALKQALAGLTGIDESLTGQFSRFRNRERITLIPFSSTVEDTADFDISDTDEQSADMGAIRAYVDGLRAGGGTAIYSALEEAYRAVAAAQARDAGRYYSVVLMSDGENNEGLRRDQFEALHRQFPPELRNVRTFTILFGGANEDEMEGLASLTGGRMFDAQAEPLSTIFKQIRGYQ